MSLIKGKISDNCANSSDALNLNTKERYQTIVGYGGAFTDAVGMNIKKLSSEAQDKLLRAYYDPKEGSRYLLGRIPLGGTDFSPRIYSYDDYTNDTTLEHFSLAQEDFDYKIPFIKKALELNPEVRFISAVWSPPLWMKTNRMAGGFGFLLEEYYQLYADYILKSLDAYEQNGIKMWGVSTGNEPLTSYLPHNVLIDMGWTPKTMGKWIVENLGPSLAKSAHNSTLLLVLEDQRISIPWFLEILYDTYPEAKNYINATTIHWYLDALLSPVVQDEVHYRYPDKFIMMTEACITQREEADVMQLGSWRHGERYVQSIIQHMNHWATSWMDWNLALDKHGGPNNIGNFVDSPIIVIPENDEFLKQPMYYALKHFSRFVDRGSVRISISETDNVIATAFVTPVNEVIAVLYNQNTNATNVALTDEQGRSLCLELPAKSINTVIYAL